MKWIHTKLQAKRQYREEIQSARMYDRSGLHSIAKDERKHAFIIKKRFRLG